MGMQCVYNRMNAMSKLKRKKSAIEESKCEQQATIKKSNGSLSSEQDSSCSKTSTGRYVTLRSLMSRQLILNEWSSLHNIIYISVTIFWLNIISCWILQGEMVGEFWIKWRGETLGSYLESFLPSPAVISRRMYSTAPPTFIHVIHQLIISGYHGRGRGCVCRSVWSS